MATPDEIIEPVFKRTRARIAGIASYLPNEVLNNAQLAALYPEWSAEKILAKTGIENRYVAAENQTAADLAYEAAKRLFNSGTCTADEIDFVILCTQAPDYFLPTSACVLQHRLGIPRSAGALDVNLGCSGFVYGLSLATGLIETGSATKVLLLTADTYSKYIHPFDKSVRTLFGDGAAATLIVAERNSGKSSIGPFIFGTDGSGARNLMVEAGAFRLPNGAATAIVETDTSGNMRSRRNLFMDGAEVMAFTLSEVPKAVAALLTKIGQTEDDFDFFVLHQANQFMLEALRKKLRLTKEKMPIFIKDCGNTVSSSIPLALEHLEQSGRLRRGHRLILVGFGVGYSWAATAIQY